MAFNPFNVPIGDQLTTADLDSLIGQVAEGYVVEFKSDFPAAAKIAHSIASLANTYGGWYIVGIKTDERNVASEVTGYAKSSHPDAISKVRDIVKSHIDPVPILYPQMVDLEQDKAVLAVYVPNEQYSPFITRDGRVYRRVHDSSSPVPETDRHAFDRLIDQGRDVRNRFLQFCNDRRTFSQSESDSAWLNLYLLPHQIELLKPHPSTTAALDDILRKASQELDFPMVEGVTMKGRIPFTTVQPTPQSSVLRYVDPSRVGFNSLTVELFADGRCKIHIPLTYLRTAPRESDISSTSAREALRPYRGDGNSGDTAALRYLDSGRLTLELALLIEFYKSWLGDLPELSTIEFAASFYGVWRTVPFFDADEWGRRVQRYGLPVVGSDDIWVGLTKDQGYRIKWADGTPEWMTVSGIIYQGLGMPFEFYASSLAAAVLQAQQRGDYSSS